MITEQQSLFTALFRSASPWWACLTDAEQVIHYADTYLLRKSNSLYGRVMKRIGGKLKERRRCVRKEGRVEGCATVNDTVRCRRRGSGNFQHSKGIWQCNLQSFMQSVCFLSVSMCKTWMQAYECM